MIAHYLKVAVRNLLKHKAQNVISVVGLAVGLFCFCVCFYISRFIGSIDECYENHERIAGLYLKSPKEEHPMSSVVGPFVPDIRKRNWQHAEAFTQLSFVENKEFTVIGRNDEKLPYELMVWNTDSLFRKVFTPTLLMGNWEQASQTPNAVVLVEKAARRMFGDAANAIGKQLTLEKPSLYEKPIVYTVQAVIKNLPENTSTNFMTRVDMLTLNDDDGYTHPHAAYMTGYKAYVLLKEGSTAQQFEQETQQENYTYNTFREDASVVCRSMGDNKSFQQQTGIISLITSLAGLLVLLTASLNFFHFQTGSFLNRGREFGIRKILGNTTSGLFLMQFVQIVIVILAATLISGCLLELASPFLHVSVFNISIQMVKDELLTHLMQYMGMLLVLTALVAAGIALYIRRSTLRVSMQGGSKVNSKKRLRNTLLGVQLFICWLFVALAAALYLQSEKTTSSIIDTLTRQEKKEIVVVPLEQKFLKEEDRQIILDHIRQHSGVMDVMTSETGVLSTWMTSIFESSDRKKGQSVRFARSSSNFASFLKLGLEGRAIEKEDEMVVGRNFADQYNGDIIGKTLYDFQKAVTVVGVMDNLNNYVYNDGYGKEKYPNVYFLSGNGYKFCYVKCYPGKVKEVETWIMQKLLEVFPSSIEPETYTLLEQIERYQALETNLKGIILFFSIVCLIITLLGVYSAITLDTERRQKEVAIRKVNGAGLKEIILLFARLYVWMLGVSFVLAAPVIWLILQQWKQMYTVFFNDGILYWGGVFVGVALITALTVVFRILKIARINPATIIKSE